MSTIIGLVSTFRLPLQSAPAQIRAEKSVGAKSAVKMQKWGQKAPSKQQSDGKKCHHF